MTIQPRVPSRHIVPKIAAKVVGWLRRWMTPHATEHNEAFRERTLRGMVLITFFSTVIVSLIAIAVGAASRLTVWFFLIPFLVGTAIALVRKRIHLAGWIMVALFTSFSVIFTLQSGYWAPGAMLFFVLGLVLGVILLPPSSARIIPLIVIALYAGVTFWMAARGVVNPLANGNTVVGAPVPAAVSFAFTVMLFSGAGFYLIREYDLQRRELKTVIETLEERVADRTRDLTVAAEVSAQISSILELDKLLPQLVERTRAEYGLYHVAVFLFDEEQQFLRYEAGTGAVGERIKQEGKVLRADNPRGLVVRAARTGQPVVVNDVVQEPDFLPNPLLPEIRAEVALPLIAGNHTLGVLALQSDQFDRFGPDELTVLMPLSNQLAVAIQNARLYAEQIQVAEKLRQLDEIKSEFLASMSHELRSPLSAILSYIELMSLEKLGPVTEKQQYALGKTMGSGKHLLSLINDVLDLSKIQSNMMRLYVEAGVDLHYEIATVADTLETLLKDRPVKFIQDVCDDLPLVVGDRRRIRQILLNLLSNAAKFTEKGTITLSVKHESEQVVFMVSDTGPGIAKEDQELIFEPFRQTETGMRHAASTGLGLPISRKLAEAHGGRLWVESEPGEGATFYVALPVRSPALIEMMEASGKD